MRKLSIVIFLLVLAFSACKDPEPVEIREVQITDLKSIGQNMVQVNANLKVFNPNRFGATVDNADLTIYINDIQVGRIEDIDAFSMPGKKESNFVLPIRLNTQVVQNAMKKEWTQLFSNKGLNLIIKGDIHAKMGVLSRKIPVNHAQDVKKLLKDLL